MLSYYSDIFQLCRAEHLGVEKLKQADAEPIAWQLELMKAALKEKQDGPRSP